MKKSYERPTVKKAKMVIVKCIRHHAKCSGGTTHKVPADELVLNQFSFTIEFETEDLVLYYRYIKIER